MYVFLITLKEEAVLFDERLLVITYFTYVAKIMPRFEGCLMLAFSIRSLTISIPIS